MTYETPLSEHWLVHEGTSRIRTMGASSHDRHYLVAESSLITPFGAFIQSVDSNRNLMIKK